MFAYFERLCYDIFVGEYIYAAQSHSLYSFCIFRERR